MMRVIELFSKSALKNLKKIALITEKNQLSYEDVMFLTHSVDVELQSRGLRQGQTVVVSTDKPEFVLIFVLLASRYSLDVILSSPEKLIHAGIEFDVCISNTGQDSIPADRQILIEPSWFDNLGAGTLPDLSVTFGDGGSLTTMTSGSTGIPKFVRKNEASQIESLAGRHQYPDAPTSETRYLSSLFFGQSWAVSSMLNILCKGGSLISLSEHRNRILQYVDLYQVNHLVVTPAIVRNILDIDNAKQYLSSLRTVQISGAYAGDDLLKRFAEIYDGKIRLGYGASEVGGICNTAYDRDGVRAPGYLGEVRRKDLEIAFFDDDMKIIPGATEGNAGFRKIGDPDGRGYLAQSNQDESANFVDGYFILGDVLRKEGDSLYYVGRVKNIINFSGNKISLDALQSELEAGFPKGLITCVAITDVYGLEQLIVFYQSDDEITLDQVNAELATRIGAIRAVEIVKLDEMPMTISGKIDINQLRMRVPADVPT